MTLEQYIDKGLMAYTGSQQRSDSQIDKEAMRLEEEYTSKSQGDRNVDRAKEMFKDDPDFVRRMEAMEESPEAFSQSLKPMGLRTAEATFPETMRASKEGSSFPLGSAIKDVAGYPFRYGEALLNKVNPLSDPTSIERRMSQEKTGEFVGDALRSPYNAIPAMRAGQGLASLAQAPLQKALAYGTKGAMESLPSALMEQQGRMEQGKEFSPTEFGTELAAGAILPIGGKVAKKALANSNYSAAELSKSMLSKLSGKSKELLDYVGYDELGTNMKRLIKSDVPDSKKIETIKDFGQKAEEITTEVVDYLDNKVKDHFIESNPRVKQAVAEMGDIDVSDIVLDLNRKKKSILDPRDRMRQSTGVVPVGHTTGDEAIDIQLENYDKVIDKLTGRNYGEQRFTVPASQLYDIRKDIDKSINFDKTKFSTGLQRDIKNIPVEARTKIADKLKRAGARTSFPNDMKEAHEMLNLRDEITRQIGDGTNLDKTKRFLLAMGNPNKVENRILAGKVNRLMGKEAFKKSKILQLSQEYKDGMGVYNDITTGRSMLGPTLGGALGGLAGEAGERIGKASGAVFGSPMVAAPTYGAIKGAENIINEEQYISPMVKKLMRSGQSESIGEENGY